METQFEVMTDHEIEVVGGGSSVLVPVYPYPKPYPYPIPGPYPVPGPIIGPVLM